MNRGSVESSEYNHVVLSLIFLKFVSDKFEERIAGGKEAVSLLHHSSFASRAESAKLDEVIQANLADLGYGEQEGTTTHG